MTSGSWKHGGKPAADVGNGRGTTLRSRGLSIPNGAATESLISSAGVGWPASTENAVERSGAPCKDLMIRRIFGGSSSEQIRTAIESCQSDIRCPRETRIDR